MPLATRVGTFLNGNSSFDVQIRVLSKRIEAAIIYIFNYQFVNSFVEYEYYGYLGFFQAAFFVSLDDEPQNYDPVSTLNLYTIL